MATTPKSTVIRLGYGTHPQGGSLAGLWRKKLCQEPPAGTALRGFDFDMAISDTLDRTYVLDKGVAVYASGKERFLVLLLRHAYAKAFRQDRSAIQILPDGQRITN